MTKKHLWVALAVLLVLLAAVSFSSAETKKYGSYELEIIDEDANTVRITKWSVPSSLKNEETIDLTIEAEMDGYTVVEIGDSAFNKKEQLHSVIIPEGIVSIGVNAFSNCDGIVQIRFPKSLESIGTKAFSTARS